MVRTLPRSKDLAEILEGLDLPEDIAMFAKGIVALNGAALADLYGKLSFTLGIGLEYVKATNTILPYIKGTTGLDLELSIEAIANFTATIGPFSADVDVNFVSAYISHCHDFNYLFSHNS